MKGSRDTSLVSLLKEMLGKGTCSTEGVALNITIKGTEYGIVRDKDFELYPNR